MALSYDSLLVEIAAVNQGFAAIRTATTHLGQPIPNAFFDKLASSRTTWNLVISPTMPR